MRGRRSSPRSADEQPLEAHPGLVIRSGRAVLVPVYNGLFERRFPTPLPGRQSRARRDIRHPLLVSQKPLFQLLGPPEGDKRHGLISGGHIPTKIEIIREVLDWLDRYLGPVAAPGS